MKLISRINHSFTYTKIGSIYRSFKIKRNINLFRERGIIFIHVPKNAGTSINDSLYGKSIGHFTSLEFRKISKEDFDSLYKFAVIRDPFARLISAFNFIKEGLNNEIKDKPAILKTREIKEIKNMDINKFVMEWIPQYGIYQDFALMPQSHFICDENRNLIVNRLVNIKDIGNLTNIIKQDTGIIVDQIGSKNISHKPFKQVLNNQSKEYLKSLYKVDFEIFEDI